MSRDRYRWQVECPNCGKTGEATIVENDGWSLKGGLERRIESVSGGFAVINHGTDNPNETAFRCECGAECSLANRRGSLDEVR